MSAVPFLIVVIVLIIAVIIVWDSSSSSEKENKVAIHGYDPVAYFKQGKAVKGNQKINWDWNKVNWWFSKSRHRELFMQNPAAFAPQFGGNCAFSTSMGREQEGLAKYWIIMDGKLYLNANPISHFLWKYMDNRDIKANKEWKRLNEEKAKRLLKP